MTLMGPLKLRIKMPGDPTRDLPITAFIDVKRGEIRREDIEMLYKKIRQLGAHFVLILTDRSPHPEALEELEILPQIVLTVVEHRDLVKLLVVSLAKRRGIEIDNMLLRRSYENLFEKFGLRKRITDWIERMMKKGYLLHFEGFVGDTAKACRFFINSIGKGLSLEECWKLSWDIRNFLPFGIESKIIPDMGLEPLRRHAKVLLDYGFLKEKNGKYMIQKHPSEECVLELLDYYGGRTTKSELKKHFVYREAEERIFDSLIELMERKLLIMLEGREVIKLLKPPEVKRLREDVIEKYEQKKALLLNYKNRFSNILTWKKRAPGEIISLELMENEIEELIKEVSTAQEEDVIRSYTFLLRELINWYGYYVDKIDLCLFKTSELIKQLEAEIGNCERRSNELFKKLLEATKVGELKIELQELQKVRDDLNELKKILETSLSTKEIKDLLKSILGSKKSVDESQKEKLITDVDEELKLRGDWTIAEYVLIKIKEEEILEEIKNFYKTLDSLDKLTDELTNITQDFSKLFI